MRDPTAANPTAAPERLTAALPANGAPPAAANGEPPPPWAAFSPARGRFVRFVVVFSVAITLLAAANIYWRWANIVEPSSYIVVYGNESFNGTEIVITSAGRPDLPPVTLSRDNDYVAAIFLHPGSYTITATHNGERLVRQNFALGSRKAAWVNLASRHAGTATPEPRPVKSKDEG
jgi:hypothetical protein